MFFFCINVFLLYIFFFFLGFGMLDLLGTLGLLGLIGTLTTHISILYGNDIYYTYIIYQFMGSKNISGYTRIKISPNRYTRKQNGAYRAR
jgi:hypothetical protein